MIESNSLKKILVIDNDPAILDVVREALDYEGFEVMIAEETSDVGLLARQVQPQLIILDYILNGINGGELCHQLKAAPETAGLPVILFSAYPKVLKSLGDYGCDAFIEKPFNLDLLFHEVHRLLGASVPHTT